MKSRLLIMADPAKFKYWKEHLQYLKYAYMFTLYI